VLSNGGISLEPIKVELVYLPMENGDIRLAWATSIYTEDAAHFYMTFVDAGSGEVLRELDLVLQDNWSSDASTADQRLLTQLRREMANAPLIPYAVQETNNAVAAVDGASYRVYPSPFESPSHAGDPNTDLRQLVTNPADPTASPLGWHNDGSTNYTVTRGNNVHAYTDLDANNVPDPGSDPDGGAGLNFDFAFDPSMDPSTYRDAAVTNLFYWNNLIHDVTYHYGFDEAAGNFQVDNFGIGGAGGDDVRAEAQDGSGTNNANFGTPPDGARPRMQMFRWTSPRQITVASGPIAGDYTAGTASFGPPISAVGIAGIVELSNDGAGASTTDGCEPLIGFTAGRIALVDRGVCPFTLKAANAQAAGAIGVIVANNQATGAIGLGGADPSIVIPSVSVSQEDGALFKANLPLNVTIKAVGVDRDSDLDNGIIVHEYGHGISNRLTGGPSTVSCLPNYLVNNQVDGEQMGEGWSDYYALMLTGTGEDGRGIGTYSIFQPTTGAGIRPWRYSTSMASNPSTYDSIKNPAISVPHGVGTVWATMLWDMTQGFVDRYGFDGDLVSGSGGNNAALQLVTDGLKLQACNPGFVDGRDAILAADAALNGGANQCLIWDSFARRGLGFSANQGFFFTRFDGTEAFDVPVSCCTFAELNGKVGALKAGGVINNGNANALSQKLANAEKSINTGSPNAGINVLNAFVNQVYALKGLSDAQRADLINCALGIINRTRQAFPGLAAKYADAGSGMMSLQTVADLPVEFALSQSYPNPFNTSTDIRVSLPEASAVRLTVYDITGREIARLLDGDLPAGYHDVTFDGANLPSGIYFYRVNAGSFVDVKRMVLTK
jgi:hypothetical protein